MSCVRIVLVSWLLVSCSTDKTSSSAESKELSSNSTQRSLTDEKGDEPEVLPQTNVAPNATLDTAAGINSFSIALYKEVPKSGNTLLSPFSVAAALSLLELGAKGDTGAALLNAFHAKSDKEHRVGLYDLVVQLTKSETVLEFGVPIHSHTLSINNSLWTALDYPMERKFVSMAKSYYDAEVAAIDVLAPDKSAATINRWVSAATSGKIKEIVSPAMIAPLTRLILVNAIHFVGRWHKPFSERDTEELPFYVDGHKTSHDVATMGISYFFNSLANDEVTLVELPYWSTDESAKFAMTLIVPKKRDGLHAVEAQLTPALLDGWLSSMTTNAMVMLYLPKWQAETGMELSGSLRKIGLGPVFGQDADLSGISSEEGLEVSAVVHKTVITVDEKGTAAAAATSIMTIGAGASEPRIVRADHPFLYLIRDTETGAILFIGRVVDPR